MNNVPKIVGVMAATASGVIGKDNDLPWCYPEEFKHFQTLTDGHVMIMGRKTFESTPKNLFRNRASIVFSRNIMFENGYGEVVSSLGGLSRCIQRFYKDKKIFMIGGAEIAHLFLEAGRISAFYLTKIHHSYPGNIYLNLKYFDNWNEKIIESNSKYTIVELKSLATV